MTRFAILPRSQDAFRHCVIKIFMCIPVLAFYLTFKAFYPTKCAGLIPSLITRNVFPYFCFHKPSNCKRVALSRHPPLLFLKIALFEEVLVIVGLEVIVEVVLSFRFPAERLAIANLLDVLESAGNAAIAVAVKGVERK